MKSSPRMLLTTKPESLWSVILYDNLHVAIEQKIDTHP
jgi:hypothetical protein